MEMVAVKSSCELWEVVLVNNLLITSQVSVYIS